MSSAVGARAASGTGVRLQGCALVANAIISIVAGAAVAARVGATHPLSISIALNGVVCAVLGAALLGAAKSPRITAWFRARFASFAKGEIAPEKIGVTRRALALCTLSRFAQTAQYGVALAAIGIGATPSRALIAQGVHLVGAAAGDLVPNQMGVTEGAYRLFARALDLQGDPARALSIALLVRLVQLGLAVICLFLGVIVLRPQRVAEAR
jgi:hypothetical protein